MHLHLTSIALNCIYYLFHNLSMVAWMNACFFDAQMWMVLNGDSLVGVVCHDVFKNLHFSEELTGLVVANKPKTRSLVEEVIGDAQIVGTHLMHSILWFFHHYILSTSKNIICL